jgi:(2Fe-2S) ferredoxin
MSSHTKRYLVTVCQHRSCTRNGSAAVLAEFQKRATPNVLVSGCECQGQCGSGPTVKVMPDNTWYSHVQLQDVATIVASHLTDQGQPVEALLNARLHPDQSAYADLAAQYQAFIQPNNTD